MQTILSVASNSIKNATNVYNISYCHFLRRKFFLGAGRVVILGEAATLTAQTVKGQKFGMNIPGNDNRQFALNIMHWLENI